MLDFSAPPFGDSFSPVLRCRRGREPRVAVYGARDKPLGVGVFDQDSAPQYRVVSQFALLDGTVQLTLDLVQVDFPQVGALGEFLRPMYRVASP